MKIKIYDSLIQNPVKGTASITISKASSISLSAAAVELLKLKKGDKVIFCNDEDRPLDWYISTGENGFILRESGSKSLLFNSYVIRITFRESLKINTPKSFSLRIGSEPVEIEGAKWWPIITAGVNLLDRDKPTDTKK